MKKVLLKSMSDVKSEFQAEEELISKTLIALREALNRKKKRYN